MKIGSLFSGYGGLDIAVESFFHARTVWHAEFENAPSKVLAHHWPGVPNHHDVSVVDWSAVEPVDIITGGFPCQDVSMAGKRAGMVEGTRSNLWGAMRTAIETIRPQYAVIENVRGLLSATAQSDSDLEQRPGFMGDEPNVNLRALGRVLGDLVDIGFNAEWYGLRAADIGAPHGRYRVFILATNTDSREPAGIRAMQGLWRRPDTRPDMQLQDRNQTAANTEHDGQSASPVRGSDGTTAQERTRTGRIEEIHDGQPAGGHSVDGRSGHLQSPETTPHPDRASIKAFGRRPRAWNDGRQQSVVDSGTNTQWGAYEPAIRRWERVLGRTAPAPTELSAKGKPQLSPVFVEWMMGLNPGHVTSIDGISRANQLKMLGNGVVPQQAYESLRRMKETA